MDHDSRADCRALGKLLTPDGGTGVAVVLSYGDGRGTHYHSTRPLKRDIEWLRALADELEARASEEDEP